MPCLWWAVSGGFLPMEREKPKGDVLGLKEREKKKSSNNWLENRRQRKSTRKLLSFSSFIHQHGIRVHLEDLGLSTCWSLKGKRGSVLCSWSLRYPTQTSAGSWRVGEDQRVPVTPVELSFLMPHIRKVVSSCASAASSGPAKLSVVSVSSFPAAGPRKVIKVGRKSLHVELISGTVADERAPLQLWVSPAFFVFNITKVPIKEESAPNHRITYFNFVSVWRILVVPAIGSWGKRTAVASRYSWTA